MKTKFFSAKKKTIIIVVAASVLVATVIFGLYHGSRIPFTQVKHSYVIDITNPRELAGFADYVFVGRVEKQNEVVYEDVFDRETEGGLVTVGTPHTGFDVTILENEKGNLVLDQTISLWKEGGLSIDGKVRIVAEEDTWPEAGDVYMFYASVRKDGNLLVNHNFKLADSKKSSTPTPQAAQSEQKAIANSSTYQEMVAACKNEVPFERERFTAAPELLEPHY